MRTTTLAVAMALAGGGATAENLDVSVVTVKKFTIDAGGGDELPDHLAG